MATNWRTVKLGELVNFKTGKLDSNAAVPNGDYPFFTCSQETLRTNTFSFDTECVLLAGHNANGIYPLGFGRNGFTSLSASASRESSSTRAVAHNSTSTRKS